MQPGQQAAPTAQVVPPNMLKNYFDHISKTIKASDLIFDKGTLQSLENTMFQFGHQVTPLQCVAPPSYQTSFDHISETVKARDLMFAGIDQFLMFGIGIL